MAQGVDRSAYLGPFREEMNEHLQVLIRELLLLESHPDELSPVAEVFRRTHTVKGSARMMGFAGVADLAHSMEDVLDGLREGNLHPTPPLLDAMLTAADLLRELIESPPEGAVERQDVQAIIRWLSDLRASKGPADASPTAAAPVSTAAAPADPGAQAAAVLRQEASGRETVRVDVGRIDAILNLAGELMVLDGARHQWMEEVAGLLQSLETAPFSAVGDGRGRDAGETRRMAEDMMRSSKRYRRMMLQQSELVRELHYQISTLRMMPVGSVFSLVPRAARDLARQEGKEVEVVIEGEDTEIDREVLERVKDPVIHLVSNAVVHGIEPPAIRLAAGKPAIGRLRVAAYGRGEQAIVEIEDDGAGVDFDAVRDIAVRKGIVTEDDIGDLDETDCVRLLFLPGVTTSSTVSDRSGRGVGLDVVKAETDALKGHVRFESIHGRGTKVTMELPITLAFTHVLLIEAGRMIYGVPCSFVHGIESVSADRIRQLQGREWVDLQGKSVQLIWLDRLLGVERHPLPAVGRWPALVVGSSQRPIALVVDRVIGDENVIVKPLGPVLKRAQSVSGGIILGDGRVALLLSAATLAETALGTPSFTMPAQSRPRRAARHILVVDDAAITRELERGILEAAGYRVDTAVDGWDALQKLRARRFDAVVADVEMPRMDGFQLASAIRTDPALARLPIVIVSSRESDADRLRGVQLGVQAYVGKGSFDQDTLLDTIESLVG